MSDQQPFPPVNSGFDVPEAVVTRPPAPKRKFISNPYLNENRVWVRLEHSDKIPPTGQFFGYTAEVEQSDGKGGTMLVRTPREFILKPGEPAWVPEGILNVLNDAVESVPVKGSDGVTISHWEDRLRFAYVVLRNKPAPEGWVQPNEIKEAA